MPFFPPCRVALWIFFVLTAWLATAPTAWALAITRDFIPPGQPFPGFSETAESAHPVTLGAGNLVDIFDAAADMWEQAIRDEHELTLQFGWADLPGPTIRATHFTIAQGGTPNRETDGLIVFDNENSSGFYMDPNPYDHAEYGFFNQVPQCCGAVLELEGDIDLGAGPVNAQRLFAGGPGDPLMYTDMFSLALHEIGHALGLSAFNDSFTVGDDIIITGPRPFAGSVIPTRSTDPHLALESPTEGTLNTVMNAGGAPGPTFRHVLSDVDILAVSEISGFSDLEFPVIPEPSTALLFGGGLLALGLRRRCGLA